MLEKKVFQAGVQDVEDNNDQRVTGYVSLDSFAVSLPILQLIIEIQLPVVLNFEIYYKIIINCLLANLL